MAVTPEVRNLLLRAAEHIETYGLNKQTWIPRMRGDRINYSECPACIGGALAIEASGGRECSPNWVSPVQLALVDDALQAVARTLRIAEGFALGGVTSWNDLPTTTKEDAVRILRVAAQEA